MRETPRNLVLLTNTVKNYRPVSLLVCKQSLLILSLIGKQSGVARGGQHPDGQRPGGQKRGQRPPLWPEAIRAKRVRESFVLRTYVVGRVWKKKLHFDWQVKVVPASQELSLIHI